MREQAQATGVLAGCEACIHLTLDHMNARLDYIERCLGSGRSMQLGQALL